MSASKKPSPWVPGRRLLATEWIVRLVSRLVGIGMVGWEIGVDHGSNLVVLIVGYMLTTSTNVLDVVRGLVQQAKSEQMSVQEIIDRDVKDEASRTNS